MGISIVDKNSVQNSFTHVKQINDTLTGWESDTDFIRRKYIAENGSIIFDFARSTDKDKYIGYAIVRNDYKDYDAAYLSFIAVDNASQGQGVGNQLLNSTVQKVKSFAFKKLNLHCEEHNLPFYTKFAEKNKIACFYEEAPDHQFSPLEKAYAITYAFKAEKPDGKRTVASLKDRVSLEETDSRLVYLTSKTLQTSESLYSSSSSTSSSSSNSYTSMG
jgi:GNAT superfamily N-acetyltransferase